MTGIGISKENSAYLRRSLQPAYYMGFLHAALLLELRKPEPSTRFLEWLLEERQSFIEGQQSEDLDAGLLLEPVFWTDRDPDAQADEAEVLAMTPVLVPFILCSSIEPHARWAVIFHEDDKTPTFFRTGEDAREACSAAMEEGRRERENAVDEAFMLSAKQEFAAASALCDDYGISFEHDKESGQVLIDGNPMLEADGPAAEPALAADDSATRPDDGA